MVLVFGKREESIGVDRLRVKLTFSAVFAARPSIETRSAPPKGNPEHLPKGSEPDEVSPFRWYLKVCMRRNKKGACNLSLSYLHKLWLEQEGICPITGWHLRLPRTTRGFIGDNPFGMDSASIDRIDNSKPYVEGNVRFVAVVANYARNIFTDADLVKFAYAVVAKNAEKSTG